MKHKFISLFLALFASMGTIFAQSGTCGENVTWNLTNGVLTISGTGEMDNYTAYTVAPWYDYRSSITSVIIKNGVTNIGGHAFFYCTSLTSIDIPNSVTSIGGRAFNHCTSLTSINIPNSVTSISNEAFSYCSSLSAVAIGNSVTNIGSYAFFDCENLTSVYISDLAAWCAISFERTINQGGNTQYANPLYYAGNLYLNNTLVEDLVIPNGVTELGLQAFAYCTSITSVTIPEGVTSLAEGAFSGCNNLLSIKLPVSLTNIGTYAFSGCSNLTSIKIPNGVTIIGEYTFSGCTNMTSIVIPSSVTYIGYEAFSNCKSLISFTDYATKPQSMDTPCFTKVPLADATLYVPAESIALYKAYPNWAQFGTIMAIDDTPEPCLIASGTCGENLTWKFSCDSVLTISGIGEMESYSYCNCPWSEYLNDFAIKSIVIEEGVTTISAYSFSCSIVLSNVDVFIPSTVTDIDDLAFNLSGPAFYVNENNSNYSSIDGVLFNKDQTKLIAYPRAKEYTQYTIPNTVNYIGSCAFYGCDYLESVIIPNSVTRIENSAFRYCENISSIVIPNSVTTIGSDAFEYCDNLTTIFISSSVTSIGNSAFAGDNRLLSINVDEANPNYSSLNGVLFNKDQTILMQYPIGKEDTRYTIPNTVTTIDGMSFSYISANCELTSVVIPNSVTTIKNSAFWSSSHLTSITNYADIPQPIVANVFRSVDLSVDTLYVPAGSIAAYKSADVWKEFGSIQAISDSAEITYASIADLYNMAADSTFTLGAFDVVYVASYQNGANMYIKDKTGSMVIYKPNYGLQAGDHVEAGLQGKINIYHGLYEIAPISTKEELTVTAGEAPAPMEATEVPSETNVNQFVVFKNVSFATDTAFVEGRRHIVYGEWNGQEIIFFNQYFIGATLSANKTYNITAVNTIYGTSPQAYPLMVEEAASEPCLIASGSCGDNLTWELSCDSVLSISGTGAMTDFSFNFSQQIPLTPWNSYLYAIKSIAIADSVTNIGNWAFHGCVSLTNVTIPQNVVSLGKGAFSHCSGMTSITIPNSVTSIGEQAFRCCYSLTSVTIPNRVTSIAGDAFSACHSLTSVNIPNSVTNIKTSAFQACSGLISVTIPKSVSSIGMQAFLGCTNLTSITCEAITPPSCENNVFYEVDKSIPLYVPGESVTAYKAADVWKEFFNILPIEESFEPTDSIYNVVYIDQAGLQLDAEAVTLHLPKAPEIEGFTFLKWQVVTGDLEDGIYIQAVYEANKPSNTPAEVPVPGNRAQKLIRNGNVYILTNDKTYTVTGQEVK